MKLGTLRTVQCTTEDVNEIHETYIIAIIHAQVISFGFRSEIPEISDYNILYIFHVDNFKRCVFVFVNLCSNSKFVTFLGSAIVLTIIIIKVIIVIIVIIRRQ